MNITLRIVCLQPPPESYDNQPTIFGLQDKDRQVLIGNPRPDVGNAALEYQIALKAINNSSGKADFTGKFAHGTPKERFLYFAYAYANYHPTDPNWIRRFKISLNGISWGKVEAAIKEGKTLFAQVDLMKTKGVWAHPDWQVQ